jgi:hypothetical protein
MKQQCIRIKIKTLPFLTGFILKRYKIERKGTFYTKLWKSFDAVTKKSDEASDHHLVWAEFTL